jgi:hypothetical protein
MDAIMKKKLQSVLERVKDPMNELQKEFPDLSLERAH